MKILNHIVLHTKRYPSLNTNTSRISRLAIPVYAKKQKTAATGGIVQRTSTVKQASNRSSVKKKESRRAPPHPFLRRQDDEPDIVYMRKCTVPLADETGTSASEGRQDSRLDSRLPPLLRRAEEVRSCKD